MQAGYPGPGCRSWVESATETGKGRCPLKWPGRNNKRKVSRDAHVGDTRPHLCDGVVCKIGVIEIRGGSQTLRQQQQERVAHMSICTWTVAFPTYFGVRTLVDGLYHVQKCRSAVSGQEEKPGAPVVI